METDYEKTDLGKLWSIFGFSAILLIVAFTPNLPMPVRILLIAMGFATIITHILSYRKNELDGL